MTNLPCGCDVEYDDDETTIFIRMRCEDICMWEGAHPSVESYRVCNQCYEERYSKYPDLILTDEEEIDWLNTKFN